jgi:hypothetical protein
MPTNQYVNHFGDAPEQNLIHDLLIESIKFYGMDVHWMPRITSATPDNLLGEDTLESFNRQYPIEMYIKNVEGFEGEGEFLSKFGLDIRDQITFSVSIRRFEQLGSEYARPREGDLIYFPLNKKVFQIQFVEHESIFYPTGTLPVYDIRCELFVYNQQAISTGIDEIDEIASTTGPRAQAFANTLLNVTTEDNMTIEDEAESILDFSDSNPFGSF